MVDAGAISCSRFHFQSLSFVLFTSYHRRLQSNIRLAHLRSLVSFTAALCSRRFWLNPTSISAQFQTPRLLGLGVSVFLMSQRSNGALRAILDQEDQERASHCVSVGRTAPIRRSAKTTMYYINCLVPRVLEAYSLRSDKLTLKSAAQRMRCS